MSMPLLVDSMLSVGQHYSMDLKDLRALCVKMMVLSLKYVDRQCMWEALFPGHFVDWDLVRPGSNVLGDLHLWLPLLELCEWDSLDRVQAEHPPLLNMRKALRAVGLDNGLWTMPCQLLIVQMLQGVPVHQGFEMLSCRILKRDTHQSSAMLLAALSDTPHTPEMYERTLCAILGPCMRLATAELETHVRASEARREDFAKSMRVKNLRSYEGRPRLRDRATPSDEQKVNLDTRLGTWETYTGFCQLHQFPNVLSETVKSKLYFLASQTGWAWGDHIHRITGGQTDLCGRVAQYPVSRPDLRVLNRCIEGLSMDGAPPFPEMTEFRRRCFKSFPVSQAQRMNLTQVLRLYVCAHQNPEVWKELWKMQLCLLSPQIIKDCEAFAADTPFAAHAFMRLFTAG